MGTVRRLRSTAPQCRSMHGYFIKTGSPESGRGMGTVRRFRSTAPDVPFDAWLFYKNRKPGIRLGDGNGAPVGGIGTVPVDPGPRPDRKDLKR